MFWILVGLLALLFAYLGSVKIKYRYIYRALLVITLAFPVGFGGTSSVDHEGYARNYNYMSSRSVSELISEYDFIGSITSHREETYEVGFTAFIILINKLGFTEAAFFVIVALLTSGLYVSLFYRFKLTPLIVLVFLTTVYYSHQANLVRQMVAVTLFLYSVKYLEKEMMWKYILIVLLASTVHTSALLLLLFAPLSLIKRDSVVFWNTLLAIWLFTLPIALHLININLYSFSYILNYTISVDDSINVGARIDFDIVYNSFVLLLFVLRRYIPVDYVKYAALFVIGGILLNVSQQMTLIYRFALYFTPLLCVFIPNLLNLKPEGWKLALPLLRMVVLGYYSYIYLSSLVFVSNPPFTRNMYTIADLF